MVRLFEQPLNIVNQRDVSLVIKVDFADLGRVLCGGAIRLGGCKMCVKPRLRCTMSSHRKSMAVFVLKHISVSNMYVLITVAGQIKNQVWLTTSATIEKLGDVWVTTLQAEVTKLKRGSNDTVIKVGYEDLPSVDSFAAWWKTNCTVSNVNGHAL